jgi:hypothetical protein
MLGRFSTGERNSGTIKRLGGPQRGHGRREEALNLSANRTPIQRSSSLVAIPSELQKFFTIINKGTYFQWHTVVNCQIWINELRVVIFISKLRECKRNQSSCAHDSMEELIKMWKEASREGRSKHFESSHSQTPGLNVRSYRGTTNSTRANEARGRTGSARLISMKCSFDV